MAAVNWLETLRVLEIDLQRQANTEEDLADRPVIGGKSTRQKLLDWAEGLRSYAGEMRRMREGLLGQSAEQMAVEAQNRWARGEDQGGAIVEQLGF